jgi:copper chaperone
MTAAKDNIFIDLRHGVQQNTLRMRLILDNIKCGGCGKTITSAMTELGFKNVVVDPDASYAEFDKPADIQKIEPALNKLKELGYPLIDTAEGLAALALKARSYLSCAVGKMS